MAGRQCPSTIKGLAGVAQLVRARGSYPRSPGFKSLHRHQFPEQRGADRLPLPASKAMSRSTASGARSGDTTSCRRVAGRGGGVGRRRFGGAAPVARARAPRRFDVSGWPTSNHQLRGADSDATRRSAAAWARPGVPLHVRACGRAARRRRGAPLASRMPPVARAMPRWTGHGGARGRAHGAGSHAGRSGRNGAAAAAPGRRAPRHCRHFPPKRPIRAPASGPPAGAAPGMVGR